MASKVQRQDSVRLCSPIIPDELIEVEILGRLDVKSLHKFKCVSKRYESIISSPKFGVGYTEKAYSSAESLSSSGLRSTMLFPHTGLSHPTGTRYGERYNLKDLGSSGNDALPISVNFISVPDILRHLIIASTNGLVLCREDWKKDGDLWVSNPLTKQCIKLPVDPEKDGLVRHELNRDRVDYGFASRRDEATGLVTYKVVAFGPRLMKKGCKVVRVHIFSSESGRWVAWEVPLPETVYNVPRFSFSHKGSLYFISRGKGVLLTYNPYDSPARFDHISLPAGSDVDQMSLVYSGAAVGCWETTQCSPNAAAEVTVWRLEEKPTPWWCFERSFQIESPRDCVTQLPLVALFPWDRDVVCRAHLVGNGMAVINQRNGTWETVRIIPHGEPAEHGPLFNIHLTPWSSPFYAQPARISEKALALSSLGIAVVCRCFQIFELMSF